MDRRTFLTSSAACAALGSLPWHSAGADSRWRTFEVTTRVEIQFPDGVSRAWIPLPLAGASDWHRDHGDRWTGNAARAEVLREPPSAMIKRARENIADVFETLRKMETDDGPR